MSPYKNDLEAAHQRIFQLEKEKEEAERKQKKKEKRKMNLKKFFVDGKGFLIIIFFVLIGTISFYFWASKYETEREKIEHAKDNMALTMCKERYPNGVKYSVSVPFTFDYYICRFYAKENVGYKREKSSPIFIWEVEEALNKKKAVEKERR